MIHLGEYNTLTIIRETEPGLFLSDEEDNEVLLPNRYVPNEFKIWDKLDVFVYLDNQERLVAVTDKPYIQNNEFALLRCNEVTKFGAFLDWGMVKELFCPFKEQAYDMKKGGWYLVFCFLDEETNRLVASSKTNQFLENKELTVAEYDEVDLIASHKSDIGWNVIINKIHSGLIYTDNIFQDISVGDKLKGIVKKIRPGNKIDIILGQVGYRNIEPNAEIVMSHLQDNNGFLDVTDKSSPEKIKDVLQMSKKSFKKAVGNLYRQKLIEIKEDGIHLVN